MDSISRPEDSGNGSATSKLKVPQTNHRVQYTPINAALIGLLCHAVFIEPRPLIGQDRLSQMTHLQDQLDEFLLLESVYSSPGEFEIQDEASHRQAEAYLQGATPHPPKALSCLLRIPISAHHRSDDEDSEGEDDAVAGDAPSHSVAISVRLPSRCVYVCVQ